MKKRLILFVLCVFSCMMLLAACGTKKEEKSRTNAKEAKLVEDAKAIFSNFSKELWLSIDFSKSFEEFIQGEGLLLNQYFSDEEAYEAWYDANVKVTEEIGKYKSFDEDSIAVTSDEHGYKYTGNVETEDGKAIFSVHISKDFKSAVFGVEEVHTLSKKLEMAALNTAFGMFFIFIVLIFISLVIKALSILPKLFAPKEEKKPEVKIEAPAVSVTEETSADLSGEELTAVMTAAIMAYRAEFEEAPADGLFVRSIKRKNISGWKRA